MKSFNILLISIALTVTLNGCDFLDTGESTYYDKDEIIYDPSQVSQLCTQVYSYLPNGFKGVSDAMQDAATDDAIHIHPTAQIQRFVNGAWSPNYVVDDVFDDYYNAIHDANFYLENCTGLTFDDWKASDGFQDTYKSYLNYEHEVRFLRAFYYFELVKRYQNVPLVTKCLSKNEANQVKQSSAEDVLKFIIEECTEVSKHLPDNPTALPGAKANMQRIGKGAALALKSRATLYLASPLFNEKQDMQRWKDAASAAYEVIEKSTELGLKIDPDYQNLFGETNNRSAEVILCRPEGKSTHFESANYPIGIKNGSGYTCPTENLVSAYEMKDGNKFDWNNPTSAKDPYKDRDPRLMMTIVCNGMKWPAKEPVETFIGGRNGQPLLNATPTGYYLKKYLNNKVSFETGQTTKSFDHNWILFRYAEILLNYAEAAAHAYGPDVKPAGCNLSACDAVNMVRNRNNVNMPPFPKGMSRSDFLERLQNERRVELAFENHRFWDLRRWKKLGAMQDIYKVSIRKENKDKLVFQKEKLKSYEISNKMYFYPLSNTELYKNRNLVQNPGWTAVH